MVFTAVSRTSLSTPSCDQATGHPTPPLLPECAGCFIYNEPMEPQIIESMVTSLPKSEMGEIQADSEIWEETDGGAHFKVTRHWITYSPAGAKVEVVALSVSGVTEERRRIIGEFVDVFGVVASHDPGLDDGIETALWVVND